MSESTSIHNSPQRDRVETTTPATPVQGEAQHDESTSRTTSTSRFSPDAIVAAIAGVVLLVLGLVVVTRAGVSGPLRLPVVTALGFTHTAILGIIEIVFGAGLLLAGATASRTGALIFSATMGIAAFVGAVQTKSFKSSLALESGLAWLAVIVAVVVAGAALLAPRYTKHSTVVTPR